MFAIFNVVFAGAKCLSPPVPQADQKIAGGYKDMRMSPFLYPLFTTPYMLPTIYSAMACLKWPAL